MYVLTHSCYANCNLILIIIIYFAQYLHIYPVKIGVLCDETSGFIDGLSLIIFDTGVGEEHRQLEAMKL